MNLVRDPNSVEPMKLTDIQMDSDFINLLYSIKETLKTTSLQQKPPQGYEFEGMKYFEGKMLKIFQNGAWQDFLDFSKVDYSDVKGLPQISGDYSEDDDEKIAKVKYVKSRTRFGQDNYKSPFLNDTLAFNSQKEFDIVSPKKINDLNQQSFILNDQFELKFGMVVISPELVNTRQNIIYRHQSVGELMGAFFTPIGHASGLGAKIGVVADHQRLNDRYRLWFEIWDKDNLYSGWTSKPPYTLKEYRFFWLALFAKTSQF